MLRIMFTNAFAYRNITITKYRYFVKKNTKVLYTLEERYCYSRAGAPTTFTMTALPAARFYDLRHIKNLANKR